jgi:hypothetical protein
MIIVTDDIKTERLNLCNKCDYFLDRLFICSKCGCFMKVKATISFAKCPIGLWDKVQ